MDYKMLVLVAMACACSVASAAPQPQRQLRYPRIYNAYITTDKKLQPSKAYPHSAPLLQQYAFHPGVVDVPAVEDVSAETPEVDGDDDNSSAVEDEKEDVEVVEAPEKGETPTAKEAPTPESSKMEERRKSNYPLTFYPRQIGYYPHPFLPYSYPLGPQPFVFGGGYPGTGSPTDIYQFPGQALARQTGSSKVRPEVDDARRETQEQKSEQ